VKDYLAIGSQPCKKCILFTLLQGIFRSSERMTTQNENVLSCIAKIAEVIALSTLARNVGPFAV